MNWPKLDDQPPATEISLQQDPPKIEELNKRYSCTKSRTTRLCESLEVNKAARSCNVRDGSQLVKPPEVATQAN